MTLSELVASKKCRVGRCFGTTKSGRYWLACDPILIMEKGNGWDSPEVVCSLLLASFDDGHFAAMVSKKYTDNRNQLQSKNEYVLSGVGSCCSVEDVEVHLKKGIVVGQNCDSSADVIEECYKDCARSELFRRLVELGLPEYLSGPDC